MEQAASPDKSEAFIILTMMVKAYALSLALKRENNCYRKTIDYVKEGNSNGK